MAFKMKGSAFKSGGVQGTSGHASALKQKEDSALQCRMYNKASQFTMKSPLEQSCPAGTIPVDEEGNPIQMKSALKQYTEEEIKRRKKNEAEGYTYKDETSEVLDDGSTVYTTEGTKPGSGGERSGNPEFSAAFADARKNGLDTFEFDGKSYNTKKSTGPETDEMSYTEGPKIVPLSLPTKTPTLIPDSTPTPELNVLNKKGKKIMKKLSRKPEKNKRLKKIVKKIKDIDLIPGDKKSRRNWRKNTLRKVGKVFSGKYKGNTTSGGCL